MDVLHKINTLVREWIKDVSRQKVNFVLWLKNSNIFSFTSKRLCMHTEIEDIWNMPDDYALMIDFMEY